MAGSGDSLHPPVAPVVPRVLGGPAVPTGAVPTGAVGMSGVRLVATDLDGTLLRRDGTVSARTRAALEGVAAAGVEVVLVTARPARWVLEIARSVACNPLVVCSNGGVVFDARTGSVVTEHVFERAAALEIVRRLRVLLAGVSLGVETGTTMGYEPDYLGTWARPGGALVGSAEELLERRACKVVARHAETGDHWAVVTRVREAVADLGEVTSSGHDAPIEIAPPGVSKALGLEAVASREGVASGEVLAFGDMPNDLSMLGWAGRAVAPANAHADVLAIVDRVTGDCDHDGVASVLEELAGGRASPARGGS